MAASASIAAASLASLADGSVHGAAGFAGGLTRHVVAAGLVDVDVTAIVQFAFFLTLVLVLPKLIFEPLLRRFEQRDARTEGARVEARRMLKDADEQVAVFERAMADEKQRALAERAAARQQAAREGQDAIAKVRAETTRAIDQGIARLRADGERARQEIEVEAKAISGLIVAKIIDGRG